MVEAITQAPIFEFTGNWLCLDFTNTVNDRLTENPREMFNSYADLLAWGQQAQIVAEDGSQRLFEEVARHPKKTFAVLQRAIALREAIYNIFAATARDASPGEIDLAILNTELAEAMSQARIVPEAKGFVWDWTGNQITLDRILWIVARSAADLLLSGQLRDVRECSASDCGWLFLDTSKNHSRRWCDMKGCGNRAKVRRHYERKKQTSA